MIGKSQTITIFCVPLSAICPRVSHISRFSLGNACYLLLFWQKWLQKARFWTWFYRSGSPSWYISWPFFTRRFKLIISSNQICAVKWLGIWKLKEKGLNLDPTYSKMKKMQLFSDQWLIMNGWVMSRLGFCKVCYKAQTSVDS